MLSTRQARLWRTARQNFLLQALESRCHASPSSYAPPSSSSFSSTSIARASPQASTSTPGPSPAPALRIAIPTPKSASSDEPAWLRSAYPTTLPQTSASYDDLIFRYRNTKNRSADRSFSRVTFLGDHQAGIIANEITLYFLNTWDQGRRFRMGPLRSHLITNNHMACLAAQYGIPERTFTGGASLSEPIQQSRHYGKWLADSLEAHLGCLYEEKGVDAVRDFLAPIFYLELASRVGPYLPDFDFESVKRFKEEHATLPERKAFWASLKPPTVINSHLMTQAKKQEKEAAGLAKQKAHQEAKRKEKEAKLLKAATMRAAKGRQPEPQAVNQPAANASQTSSAPPNGPVNAQKATVSSNDATTAKSEAPTTDLGVESIARMLREAHEALQAHERNHFALHKQIHDLQREYSIQKRSTVASTKQAQSVPSPPA